MTGYMRLWNPDWYSSAIPEAEIRKKDVHGKYPMTFEIRYTGTGSANATEIGAAADNALDGTTTPVLLYIESTDAKDTIAGVGVRKVRLIGLSVASAQAYINGKENEVYSVEEINMTTSAHTLTTRYYLRVIHLYASDWGSEKDAAGTLTAGDDATPTTTYLTIAISYNESNNGGLIYVAEGYHGRWKRLLLNLNDASQNAGA